MSLLALHNPPSSLYGLSDIATVLKVDRFLVENRERTKLDSYL